MLEKSHDIITLHASGLTLKEIGNRYKVSAERIRQIIVRDERRRRVCFRGVFEKKVIKWHVEGVEAVSKPYWKDKEVCRA